MRGRVRRTGAGLVAGLGIGLSLPPFGWWPLAWLGCALLALALWRDRAVGRMVTGLAAGAGQFGLGLWWVNEFQSGGYVALVVLCALFLAAAALLVPARRFAFVATGLPPALVAADWARDRFPFGGFPLGGISLGQTGSPLVATARWGGSLAVTGMTAVAGVVIAGAVLAWRGGGADQRRRRRSVAAVGLAAALAVGAVLAGYAAPDGGAPQRSITVALVQGGGKRGTRAVDTNPNTVFARHQALSATIAAPVDLVVWPEGMLQTDVDYRSTNGAQFLSGLARRLQATVVAGVEQDAGPAHYTNQVVAWGPDGRVTASYQKNRLVPFGEYVPDRWLISALANLRFVPRDAIAGHGPGILRTPAGPLGVMISYEVFFDSRARSAVDAGGQVLLVPTDTASYADTQVPTEELAAAELRAWETGRTVLQVTPTGYSAVIGPNGQIQARTDLDQAKVLDATVALRSGLTIYVRLGDRPFLALAVAALAALWLSRLRAARSPSRDGAAPATPAAAGTPEPAAAGHRVPVLAGTNRPTT